MRSLIAALLVLFVTTLPNASSTADLSFLNSIVPVTIPIPDSNGIGKLHVGCTATSIGDHEWLTAAHCIQNYQTYRFYVLGDEIAVTKLDVATDLAKLVTRRVSMPALKLSEIPPNLLDEVIVAGYPLGSADINVVMGRVSGFQLWVMQDIEWPFMFVAASGARGESGAPILNLKHELVSVVQMGFSQDSFSPQMGGVPFETLKTFLNK